MVFGPVVKLWWQDVSSVFCDSLVPMGAWVLCCFFGTVKVALSCDCALHTAVLTDDY